MTLADFPASAGKYRIHPPPNLCASLPCTRLARIFRSRIFWQIRQNFARLPQLNSADLYNRHSVLANPPAQMTRGRDSCKYKLHPSLPYIRIQPLAMRHTVLKSTARGSSEVDGPRVSTTIPPPVILRSEPFSCTI